MNRIAQWLAAAALCAATLVAVVTASAEPGFSGSVTPGLITHFTRLHGQGVRGRLDGWREFVRRNAALEGVARGGPGEVDVLQPVNGFFNRMAFLTDLAHWGAEEYWATPAEFLASNAGDCEDYAIAKYFTLRELGIPVGRLRLVYAKISRSGAAHMVLAYYSAPGVDPLIMDNLERGISRASDRPDLIPVYLFNDDDLEVLQRGAPATRHDAQSNRKWRDVLDKLARELAT